MLSNFIITFGYIGIFITVFAESGFLLGFFLPGDSLLFTVGLLAAEHYFNITVLIVLAVVAAISGDSFGYFIGKTFGKKLFKHEDSLLFKREYVTRTEDFFKKHGKKTIIMARFIPIIRTFAPVMAGVGTMEYPIFFVYNIIGGTVWAAGLLLIAYSLGIKFPIIQHYVSWVIILIIVVSFIPVAIDLLRKK